jgi:hypothetical protein
MRALGVTIMVAAAIAASLTFARQRQPDRRPEPETSPSPPLASVGGELDAIRAAGF